MTNQEIASEIKGIAIDFFKHFEETKDNQFGYVTEKIKKIKSLNEEESWIAFNMLHANVREILFLSLSKESQTFLIENKINFNHGSDK